MGFEQAVTTVLQRQDTLPRDHHNSRESVAAVRRSEQNGRRELQVIANVVLVNGLSPLIEDVYASNWEMQR